MAHVYGQYAAELGKLIGLECRWDDKNEIFALTSSARDLLDAHKDLNDAYEAIERSEERRVGKECA